MVLSPRDRVALITALRSAMGEPQADRDPQHAFDFYRSTLSLSWTHMSSVVGTMGAKTITDHGARMASRKCPDVELVRVSDEGVDFTMPLASDVETEIESRLACMEELCVSVLEILGELTGDVIVVPLLEKLKEEQTRPV